MSDRPLKLARALRVIPETGSLAGLREALIADSHAERAARWSGAAEYATLEQREANPSRLLERIPELAERARERAERTLRHTVLALQAVEAGDEAGAARELILGGEVAEEARHLEEAERFYAAAVTLGRKPKDRRSEALARMRLARVHRARGASEEALREYRLGFEIAEASGDRDRAVVACQGAGNVHVDRGEWQPAREWYTRGLELLEGGAPVRQEWEICSNLAIVARREGKLDESADWLARAGRIIEELADPAGAFFIGNGVGRLRIAQGEPRAAEQAFRGALANAGDEVMRTLVFVNLSESLLLQGRLGDAEELARKAEEMALLHRVTGALPEIYRILGGVAGGNGSRDGFVFFEQALALLERDAAPLERALTEHQYALFNVRMGERDLAVGRLREAIATYERLSARPEAEQAREALRTLVNTTDPDNPGAEHPAAEENEP
jgi:tetratricopeptide (TPR) repeat protein